MTRYWLIALTTLFLLAPTGAEARKVALVIGNSDYSNTSRLNNPANDIRIIAASAKQAGFDDVTVAADLAVNDFQKAMRDFRAKADGAEVAMVYYAGHGIEAQGKNWLIPTDAQLKSDLDLPYEAINLDRMMEAVSGAQIRMVVLDSCRNNPFGRSWRSGT
ncbi:caspase family protein, partial [Sphingopyxis sp.]|uniref:caspase family protein n=1 Tax=Sphingopyxis sp. TaxID=1908224 RepID=UPI002ED7C057